MKLKRADCRAGSATAMLAAGSLVLAACAEEVSHATPEKASDPALFMMCAESRGSLHELEAMAGGGKHVDTGALEHGVGMLGQLADRVSATANVRADLGRWTQALTTWRDQLRAIPPRIESGHFVEPDTSELDRALLSELQGVSKQLADWVNEVCEGVQL